jgi:hypothetical protein
MKTISEVRKSFWLTFTEFKSEYRAKKRQNSYNATIRSAFVDYVDSLAKDGTISYKLANRVTL